MFRHDSPVQRTVPFVVAIGTSTGGPAMLHRVLPRFPVGLGAAVAIVQHMPPGFVGSLARELDQCCALAVGKGVHGKILSTDQVVIAPGGKQMKLQRVGMNVVVSITDAPPENGCRPSVDYLFRSVANVCGSRAIGVVLTGMGHDGTAGCRVMRKQGARILAQSEESCVAFGMPSGPIEQRLVDFVGWPEELADHIVEFVCRKESPCN